MCQSVKPGLSHGREARSEQAGATAAPGITSSTGYTAGGGENVDKNGTTDARESGGMGGKEGGQENHEGRSQNITMSL